MKAGVPAASPIGLLLFMAVQVDVAYVKLSIVVENRMNRVYRLFACLVVMRNRFSTTQVPSCS